MSSVPRLPPLSTNRVFLRAEAADDVRIACLKANRLGIFVPHEAEDQFVEIGKAILLPSTFQ